MAGMGVDYLISAVRYNEAGTHIEALRVQPYAGGRPGLPSTMSRGRVIAKLRQGKIFVTVYRQNGNWQWGAPVKEVVTESWIRTDEDRTRHDNLGTLPRF